MHEKYDIHIFNVFIKYCNIFTQLKTHSHVSSNRYTLYFSSTVCRCYGTWCGENFNHKYYTHLAWRVTRYCTCALGKYTIKKSPMFEHRGSFLLKYSGSYSSVGGAASALPVVSEPFSTSFSKPSSGSSSAFGTRATEAISSFFFKLMMRTP